MPSLGKRAAKAEHKVGIFSGSFDPVHSGHISFALQAMELAELDEVCFLPERRPRSKTGVEHFAHRVAMLKQACRPYPKFKVIESEEVSFSVERILPKLKNLFPDSQLAFLMGSDVTKQLPNWPNAELILKNNELIVGVRSGDNLNEIAELVKSWPVRPKSLMVIESYAPEVSSTMVRHALRGRKHVPGVLSSVKSYSNRNWLYISLS